MGHSKSNCGRYLINYAAVALLFLPALPCASQATVKAQPENPFSGDLKKYPGLLTELGHLAGALKNDVQFPPLSTQSHLLAHLPAATMYYAAFPNYGETAHQTLETLRREVQASAVLRDWWQHGELSSAGPKLEDFLAKFSEVSQYLGNELVVSGATGGVNEPGAAGRNLLIIAEVRKPGLKDFLKKMLKDREDEPQFPVRVLDPQELAQAQTQAQTKSGTAAQQLVILVRPDFVVATQSVEALRSFNRLLDLKTTGFAAAPFGQRLAEAYQAGTSVLMAADLHTIMNQIPPGTQQNQKMLERTGFKDAQYALWNYRHMAAGSGSQMELSFTGPRHGIASWLAGPVPLGGLDFVSPQAAIVSSVHLKNLGKISDDIKDISSYSNPNALANVTQVEQATHISLRDDFLALLQGEVTVEVDDFGESNPKWKMILRVSDADHLQSTLQKVLATMPFPTTQFEENGITYHSLSIPSPQKPVDIVYAFTDGFLIAASSHENLAEGIRLHKSGESFAKSAKVQESLPAGYSADVSAFFYEDPSAVAALNLRRLSPEMAEAFSRLSPPATPIVFRAYGEESAIRGVSTSGGADASVILVAAAIAIPNLMRARNAANESSAIANLRTVNVAQLMYFNAYPERGYAPDLATLGPDPRGPNHQSPEHASFIDASLGNATCTSGASCLKSGYNFSLTADCKQPRIACKEFVAVSAPLASSTGTRSFCSTSDAVVRYKFGPPLGSPISPSECRQWAPLH
jgi:type II secretory pathway pseudopilin PulG